MGVSAVRTSQLPGMEGKSLLVYSIYRRCCHSMTVRILFSMLFASGLLIDLPIGQASEGLNDDVRPLRVVTYNLLHDGQGLP